MEMQFVEIFDRFSLYVEKKEIPNNKVIRTNINDTGKTNKAILVQNSYDYYVIEAMCWDEKIFIVNGLYIYHVHEVIFAFLANQLVYDKIYSINYEKRRSTIKFYYKKSNQPILTIEIYNPETNAFDISVNFTKVDCRIFLKILDYYLSHGEIKIFNETNIVCNYGNSAMKRAK